MLFLAPNPNKTINRICGRAPQTGYGKCYVSGEMVW
jgi:hypothetical protein